MSDILQIFTGNPLATFIGKKIEAATSPELESEDWALNMEICDIINENDDDAKDAARAIKKRLQQIEQDRNFTITNRTLTVLETCVSNCSHRFHLLVMTKDFIQDLIKLIGPKNNPPIDLQERVLSLIERWAEAFRSQPDLNGVWSVYQDLKAKGVTFPQRDPSSRVPIQTPQRTVPTPQATMDRSNARLVHQQQQQRQLQQQPAGQVILENEGYNKISQDLTVVQSSIEMLGDIMKLLETPESEESDWNLAEDLNATCRQMKDRIVELIERVANEDLTIELLRLNDELNNLFNKYDRMIRDRAKPAAPAPAQPTTSSSALESTKQQQQVPKPANQAPGEPKLQGVSSRTLNELSLIDFNAMSQADKAAAVAANLEQQQKTFTSNPFDTSTILTESSGGKQAETSNSLADSLGRINLNSGALASRGAQGVPRGAAVPDKKQTTGLPEEISSVREQDFAEIENWLSTDSGRNLESIAGDMPSIEPISVPNSEFENFIASRALAGSGSVIKPNENQPSQPEPSS